MLLRQYDPNYEAVSPLNMTTVNFRDAQLCESRFGREAIVIKDLIVPPTGDSNDIEALRAALAAAKMFEARIDAVPGHSGFATIAAQMIAGSGIFGGIMRRVLSGASLAAFLVHQERVMAQYREIENVGEDDGAATPLRCRWDDRTELPR